MSKVVDIHPTKISKGAAWLLATRPKTLVSAFVPVFVGTFLAKTSNSEMNWALAFSMLFAVLCIQIGTNLINDALDFRKGSDTNERLGPLRATQQGFLSYREVFVLGMACFSLAMLFSIPLFIKGGLPLFAIVTISVLCGYGYTGGPSPLAYNGLSDLFVIIFFGWVATCTSYYLQTGIVDSKAILAGTQIGLLNTVLLAINNLRDIQEDTKTNKRTLAVRFGKNFARLEITFLIITAFLLNGFWLSLGFPKAMALPFATLPLALFLMRHIWITEPSTEYNQFLGWSALLHLLFGLCLVLGLYTS